MAKFNMFTKRLTTSMPMHPLPVLVNHGIHVALCSDDPAVFGNMGLSFDFFQVCSHYRAHLGLYSVKYKVLVASEVTGLITLGEFAKDSIKVMAAFLGILVYMS